MRGALEFQVDQVRHFVDFPNSLLPEFSIYAVLTALSIFHSILVQVVLF